MSDFEFPSRCGGEVQEGEPGIAVPRLADPMAVVRETTMTAEEKRAVLASWASDWRAVRDAVGLRRLDDGRMVKVADVLNALKHLDAMMQMTAGIVRVDRGLGSRHRRENGRHRSFRRDGDDEPPTPTPAAIRPRPPVLEGGAAAAASAVA